MSTDDLVLYDVADNIATITLNRPDAVNAEEAKAIGMVKKVVPRGKLDDAARELALSIARRHPFALRMAKRAVNQTLDLRGFTTAVQAVFDVHQFGHGNAIAETGWPVMVDLEKMRGAVDRG